METLFKVPATTVANQFVLTQRSSLPNDPNFAINYTIYSHDVNQGKDAAIHPDIAQATGEDLLEQDADLKNVVYGSRYMDSHPYRILFLWQSNRT